MDNTEQNNSVMKKKSPLPFIIAGVAALVVVAAAVIVLVFLRGGAASKKYSKQLQIADKYMTDMDYKNAVLAYNEAISINPGKADAYLGLADAYLAMGKTKKAIKALEQGLDNVTDEDGREQIQEKLDEIEDEAEPDDNNVKADDEKGPKKQDNGTSEEVAPSGQSYLDIYTGFILNKQYLSAVGEYGTLDFGGDMALYYTLYDIDGDGIAELLINNGYDGRAVRGMYCFTCDQGEVKYIGIGPTDQFVSGKTDFHGMFGLYSDLGEENWTYYYKEGLSLKSKWFCTREYIDVSLVTTSWDTRYSLDEVDAIVNEVMFYNKNSYSYEDVENGKLKYN